MNKTWERLLSLIVPAQAAVATLLVLFGSMVFRPPA